MNTLRRDLGFTLVELLVAMTIIGILTTITAGTFVSSQQRARDARRRNDLAQVQRALEQYINDYRRYPESTIDGEILACGTTGIDICNWGEPFTKGSPGTLYMARLPNETRTGYVYIYKTDTSGTKYQLFARMENLQDKMLDRNGDGVVNAGDEYTQAYADCGAERCNYGVSSSNAQPSDAL